MTTNNHEVPGREYAGIFDQPVTGDSETRGWSPNPDAITGYNGISWWSHFKDSQTGEVYRVHCTDGANGGYGPYAPEDEQYHHDCYCAIVERCHQQAAVGVREIRISRNERSLMQSFVHHRWLESAKGKCDGERSEKSLEGGLVGQVWGIPLYCDVEQQDDLPTR